MGAPYIHWTETQIKTFSHSRAKDYEKGDKGEASGCDYRAKSQYGCGFLPSVFITAAREVEAEERDDDSFLFTLPSFSSKCPTAQCKDVGMLLPGIQRAVI
jgi:hypothetical protein